MCAHSTPPQSSPPPPLLLLRPRCCEGIRVSFIMEVSSGQIALSPLGFSRARSTVRPTVPTTCAESQGHNAGKGRVQPDERRQPQRAAAAVAAVAGGQQTGWTRTGCVCLSVCGKMGEFQRASALTRPARTSATSSSVSSLFSPTLICREVHGGLTTGRRAVPRNGESDSRHAPLTFTSSRAVRAWSSASRTPSVMPFFPTCRLRAH